MDPGDGNDVLEGEAGSDTMIFNGAGGAETFDFSRDGNRLRFFRQPGNVLMSTDGLENVVVNALGSADVTTINDLTGTDVQKAIIDLGLTLGAAGGDGAADQVILNGTAGDDVVTVSGGSGTVRANGLVPSLEMTDVEATDQLSIQTLDGNDTVDSAGLAAGTIRAARRRGLTPLTWVRRSRRTTTVRRLRRAPGRRAGDRGRRQRVTAQR